MGRIWKHRERVGDGKKDDDCCRPVSWQAYEAERDAKRKAMTTAMSNQTGYESEPINVDEAIDRKPWSEN